MVDRSFTDLDLFVLQVDRANSDGFKGPSRGQILTGTITTDGRRCRYACLPPPGTFTAGRTLRPLIGRRPCKGGSAEHTAYIRQRLRVSQSVAAVPVTGSLVCISWLNLRDTTETVIFPRRWTSGDTGWIDWTHCIPSVVANDRRRLQHGRGFFSDCRS